MERFKLVEAFKGQKEKSKYVPYHQPVSTLFHVNLPMRYAVSTLGRIVKLQSKCSLHFTSSLDCKATAIEMSGYRSGRNGAYIGTRLQGLQSMKTGVSRLVLETFKGSAPSPKGPLWSLYDANHINGNTWDNRLENLEWISHADNTLHAYRELNRQRRPGATPVTIREGETYKEACTRQVEEEKENPRTTSTPHKILLPEIPEGSEIEIEGYGKAVFKPNNSTYYEVSHGGTLKEVYMAHASMI